MATSDSSIWSPKLECLSIQKNKTYRLSWQWYSSIIQTIEILIPFCWCAMAMNVCADGGVAFVHTMTNVLQIDSLPMDLLSSWLRSFYTFRLTTFLFTAHKHMIFIRLLWLYYDYATYYYFRLFRFDFLFRRCVNGGADGRRAKHRTQFMLLESNIIHSRFLHPLFPLSILSFFFRFSVQFVLAVCHSLAGYTFEIIFCSILLARELQSVAFSLQF